ncbi:MAG: pilin [Gammaproteobacteria bacterium]|nr:pilin [Gammaproteobacteria bacterium]
MINTRANGFTLVELMIAIAILVVIVGIAIPAYNGYIQEARLSAARMNIEPLRLALEDHWLDNASYQAGTWNPSGTQDLKTTIGWRPDGDKDQYIYIVTLFDVNTANETYGISIRHVDNPSEELATFRKQR